MYKDTITLFNRKRIPHGDTWYAHVIHGVNLNTDKGSIIQKYGEQTADNAVLNIRYQQDGTNFLIGDLLWLPPKEWQSEPLAGITFTGGNAFDFFWVGTWPGSDVIADDDYEPTFYDYMLGHYDYVYAVNNVAILSVIPHFEVTGK